MSRFLLGPGPVCSLPLSLLCANYWLVPPVFTLCFISSFRPLPDSVISSFEKPLSSICSWIVYIIDLDLTWPWPYPWICKSAYLWLWICLWILDYGFWSPCTLALTLISEFGLCTLLGLCFWWRPVFVPDLCCVFVFFNTVCSRFVFSVSVASLFSIPCSLNPVVVVSGLRSVICTLHPSLLNKPVFNQF